MYSFKIPIAGQHVAILTGFTNTQTVGTVETSLGNSCPPVHCRPQNMAASDLNLLLAEAIQRANESRDTVEIQLPGLSSVPQTTIDQFTLRGKLRIVGDGHTITQFELGGRSWLQTESGSQLTISNITFQGFAAQSGAVIFNQGDCTLSGCTFRNCQAVGLAGGDGSNRGGSGGGGGNAAMGGAIISTGILRIQECSFLSNSCTAGNGGNALPNNGATQGVGGKGGGDNGGGGGVQKREWLHGSDGGFGGGGGGGASEGTNDSLLDESVEIETIVYVAGSSYGDGGWGGFGGGGGGNGAKAWSGGGDRGAARGGLFGGTGGNSGSSSGSAGGGGAALGGAVCALGGSVTVSGSCVFQDNELTAGTGGSHSWGGGFAGQAGQAQGASIFGWNAEVTTDQAYGEQQICCWYLNRASPTVGAVCKQPAEALSEQTQIDIDLIECIFEHLEGWSRTDLAVKSFTGAMPEALFRGVPAPKHDLEEGSNYSDSGSDY